MSDLFDGAFDLDQDGHMDWVDDAFAAMMMDEMDRMDERSYSSHGDWYKPKREPAGAASAPSQTGPKGPKFTGCHEDPAKLRAEIERVRAARRNGTMTIREIMEM